MAWRDHRLGGVFAAWLGASPAWNANRLLALAAGVCHHVRDDDGRRGKAISRRGKWASSMLTQCRPESAALQFRFPASGGVLRYELKLV